MSDEIAQFPVLNLPPELEKFLTPSPTQYIDWARTMLGSEVGFIRDYIESTSSAFEIAFDAFDAKLAAAAEKLPEDMRYDLFEDESMTAFNLMDHFPAFTWLTTFVSIYSFLEDKMLDLAATLGRQLGIKLSPEDLRHSGIFSAKVYFTALCGISFPDEKHPWQEIQHYNRIRNAIVHSRGRLIRDKHVKAIRNYAQGKTTIVIENDHIKLSKEFCLSVLENANELLGELMELARAKIEEREAAKVATASS